MAGGDVLPHVPVTISARVGSGYDFDPLLVGTTPFISGADLALCHLEIPIGRPGEPPHGYPLFRAPVELADGLADQGWDGCSTASNHAIDQGMPGVISTLDALQSAGLGYSGTARTAEAAAQPQTYQLERAGQKITVAHIAAAFGTNGIAMPSGAPWAMQLIDVNALINEAKTARANGADLVVVSLHAGTEYITQPSAEQRAVVNALGASGAVDLVIGHHAHVPQPIETVPGGPDGTGMWVAYGLGNYMSNQDAACCVPATDSGLLVTATVTRSPAGPARVTSMEWTAITVDRRGGHRVRLLVDAIAHPTDTLTAAQARERYDRVREAVGPQATERRTPPTPTGPAPTVVPRR